ncbi:relaxase/mobilization nuclease domain-containing protein [Parerythrobacter lacustris]|uniref:MobA/VirD2-like nuclease domain-containing protein n=1 Tax=Parerythrobacter lacustris TaxID=2969984 RepID=A0ABT1XMC6_9SPHN|nr:hypothetical protein [Parerythrobacter lacustris]MCR2832402.1 hypothetical protein [Parerythrobacter lacustris]
MIIKGASRAAPNQLGRHLARTDTNERVRILQLESPASSPTEAFEDWQTLAEGTRGRKGLYHANIDPAAKYQMTEEQWFRAVDVLEEELGFTGQPRAVVMHEKNGREHIHVVWARTDIDTMTLKSDGHNFLAHERASLRLELEFGHEHVPGKHAKRDRDAQPDMPTAEIRHDEWQQAERGEFDHRARKDEIRSLFEASDSGSAFKAALEDAGYVLARGDRRDFVLLDADAKVHSLGRQLPGIGAKDLRAFMADIDAESLPTVKEARAAVREAILATEPVSDKPALDAPPQHSEGDRKQIEALRQAIIERHGTELKEQEQRHAREVETLQENQQAAADKAIDTFAREQAARAIKERPQEPGGVERLWRSIREAVNEEARVQRIADEAARAADFDNRRNDEVHIMVSDLNSAQRVEIDALIDRQGRERAALLAEQERDLKRRVEDDERARQLVREYEQRRQEAEAQQREGPERDPRAR